MKNIEVKYRLQKVQQYRKILELHPQILFYAQVHQKDIYFNGGEKRIKIRIEDEKPAVLIQYRRADEAEPRPSEYDITPIQHLNSTLRELQKKLGILGQVEKWREIYLYHNVRIHLDNVAQLGWFTEFESVVGKDADEALARQNLNEILTTLKNFLTDPVPTSYIDLILQKKD